MRTQREVLADVKRLAAEYYKICGKPLGVTGEIAEFEAAKKLGLDLAEARTAGYDATRRGGKKLDKIQIKGRRLKPGRKAGGRVPKINLEAPFDAVVLVLLDEDYDAFEIWEAPRKAVELRLTAPGSKARNERSSMGVSQFKSVAKLVWSVN